MSQFASLVKVVLFPEPEDNTDSRFQSVSQVGMSWRENDQVLLMFASQRVDSNVTASDIPVVCNFLMSFLKISANASRS